MPVAALYDIHGNLPALEAVLGDVRRAGADLVVVGGDVVPGPMPRECMDVLLELDLPARFIRGNGDRSVLEVMRGMEPADVPEPFRDVIRWSARELAGREDLLAGWPPTLEMEIGGIGEVLFCHATPRSDTEIFTRLTPDERLAPLFEGVETPLVTCGHTHMQFDRTAGRTRVVNAGSVGMPFGEPGAYWLLLGDTVDLRRTPYDLAAAAARIRATAYPQAEDFAANNVLRPLSEEKVLAAFTHAEPK
ncbi:MAG TPA: metallophosphoesterase family protein [Longimicrobium sp.]